MTTTLSIPKIHLINFSWKSDQ